MSEQSQQDQNGEHSQQEGEQELTFMQTTASVLASFFGVQSAEKRDRDFKQGNVKMFIGVGVLMTVLLLGVIAAIVAVVLP